MKDFDKRLNKGQELNDFFNDFLVNNKLSYIESGYEFNKDYYNAINLIKNKNDKTSKFVRYYPDKTLTGKSKSILIEVKNSSGIEKECYENYLSLINNLNIEILFLLKNKKLCKCQDLKFNDVNEYDIKAKMKIPVIDKVWKAPRLLNEYDYQNYLKAYKYKTSGCSFAFIDFKNTKFYELNVLLKL